MRSPYFGIGVHKFPKVPRQYFVTPVFDNQRLYDTHLEGGTTLNKPPIGLHVKILNFNGRFEAFSARYGMFLFHQPIQNR